MSEDLAIPDRQFVDSVIKKIEQSGGRKLSELGGVEKEQLKDLGMQEYAEFLSIAHRTFDTNLILDNMEVIAERFHTDLGREASTIQERESQHEVGQNTRLVFWDLTHTDSQVSSEILDRLYRGIHDNKRLVRFHSIENVMSVVRLDLRNKDGGTSIDLFNKYNEDVISATSSATDQDTIEKAQWMIDVVWADYPGYLPELFSHSILKAQGNKEIRNSFSLFANRIGAGEARKIVKDVSGTDQERFSVIEAALGFNKNTNSDLVELYKKINFEDYKPNQELNNFELNLLDREFAGRDRLIDVGCGYGRLFLGMEKKGKEMFGIDLVFDHVNAIKNKQPDSNVLVGSWKAMPFGDQTFEGGFFLGRNILHEVDSEEMIHTLSEANRVLTDDGVLIVDTPNPDKGHYLAYRQQYEESAESLGVDYYESGAIVDSPDGGNFYDRLAPTLDQFEAIAFLAGFKADIVERVEYTDEEGYENENLYWKLTKIEEKPTFDEIMDAVHRSKTSGPPLYITMI
ncbi:class I SAM-dependent methyltransferase [Candidatus Microgenomates bacterium]|nr:MAG: class I SAM-dependent methyltransferase [Candidatus Microgenomates bacterium]